MTYNNAALFKLDVTISSTDAKDGISERLMQTKALVSYILADAAELGARAEELVSALWVIERLTLEMENLHAFI